MRLAFPLFPMATRQSCLFELPLISPGTRGFPYFWSDLQRDREKLSMVSCFMGFIINTLKPYPLPTSEFRLPWILAQ